MQKQQQQSVSGLINSIVVIAGGGKLPTGLV